MANYLGIIGGYPCGGPGEPCDANNDPYFRPEYQPTRAQFSKILALARIPYWTLVNPANPTFADVPPGSQFYSYIETVHTYGVITGYPCGGAGEPCDAQNRPYFRSGNLLTRPQMIKMIDLSLPPAGLCWP
ncbi:MAG: S-layer homology domain-containing protein [Chloroflexi bacterium]|nr:S-layer homology domain-containing protein [Chloroflexota bacterium]